MMVFYPGEELCEGMVEHCKHYAWSEEKRAEMHKHSGMCM